MKSYRDQALLGWISYTRAEAMVALAAPVVGTRILKFFGDVTGKRQR